MILASTFRSALILYVSIYLYIVQETLKALENIPSGSGSSTKTSATSIQFRQDHLSPLQNSEASNSSQTFAASQNTALSQISALSEATAASKQLMPSPLYPDIDTLYRKSHATLKKFGKLCFALQYPGNSEAWSSNEANQTGYLELLQQARNTIEAGCDNYGNPDSREEADTHVSPEEDGNSGASKYTKEAYEQFYG